MYGLIDMDEPEHARLAASAKFNVGQRVRVVRLGDRAGGSYHGADIGDEFTVTWVCENSCSTDIWAFYLDEIEPVFSPGDRVRVTACNGYFAAGDVGTVERHGKHAVFVRLGDYQRIGMPIEADKLELLTEQGRPDSKNNVEVPTIKLECDMPGVTKSWDPELGACRPHIVALVKNGTPRSTSYPYVHTTSLGSATTEAERLARGNPGQEFAIYQRVAGRVAEVEMKEVA